MDCFDPTAVADPALLYRGLNCLARYDNEAKTLEVMSPGPGVLVQEPCFSARGPNAAEGDGFLITLVDNIPLERNEIVSGDLSSPVSKRDISSSPAQAPHRYEMNMTAKGRRKLNCVGARQIIQDTRDFQQVVARVILPFRKSRCANRLSLRRYRSRRSALILRPGRTEIAAGVGRLGYERGRGRLSPWLTACSIVS